MTVEVITADYQNPRHADDLVYLLNCYATDPMGGGQPLQAATQANLATELAKRPHAFSLLGYVDDQPAALANCFEVFSTFNCRPIINIHDLVVAKAFRRHGLALQLLTAIEQEALKRNSCKLTLEVLSGNHPARSAYEKFGFKGYELDPEMGQALFLDKPLR